MRLLVNILAMVVAIVPASQAQARTCTAPDAAVRLDHAIVVVRDLDTAAARFAPLGFVFKPGRMHADSLLNRHIKFRDGTELELMTVAGTPTSRMSREYAALLAEGEGGVLAALWTRNMDRVRAAATRRGHEPRITRLGAWEFVSLPTLGEAQAVFFGAGGLAVSDPDSVLTHPNGAVGLEAAWIEAGPAFERILHDLGSRSCGEVTLPTGVRGTRWGLERGSLVVVRAQGSRSRRLLGIEVRRSAAAEAAVRVTEPLPGFFVVLE